MLTINDLMCCLALFSALYLSKINTAENDNKHINIMEGTLKIELDYDLMADKTAERLLGKISTNNPSTHPERKKIFGIRNLAAYIGCSPSKAQDLKNKNAVPFYEYGGRVFFYEHEVEAALKRG